MNENHKQPIRQVRPIRLAQGLHQAHCRQAPFDCAQGRQGRRIMNNGQKKSFTLIELMVVMSVIAILLGMLYPVILGARERAKKKQAMVETRSIMLALKAYRSEYGKWPAQQDSVDKMYFTNNYKIIGALTTNSRRRIFLSFQTNSMDSYGNYVDPWGVPYFICMDQNADINIGVCFTNSYSNQFSGETNISYSCSNYYVKGIEAGAASFGGTTNIYITNSIAIHSWDEIL